MDASCDPDVADQKAVPMASRPKPRSTSDSMFDTALTSVAITGLTLVSGIVLARLLGPEGRGQYGTILFWGQFAISFVALSLFESLTIRLRNRSEPPEHALTLSLIFAIGAFGVVSIVGVIAVEWKFVALNAVPADLFLSAVLIVTLIRLTNKAFVSIESASLAFGRINFDRVLAPTMVVTGAVLLLLIEQSALLWIVIVSIASRIPVLVFRFVRFFRHLFHRVNFELLGEVLRLWPKLYLASIALLLSQQADKLVIVSIWPAEWLGYYFVAYTACGAGFGFAMQAIRITLLPSLAGLPGEERTAKIEQLLRLSILAALMVAIPFWVLAPFLIPLVYGAEFLPAVEYVQGLMFAIALQPANTIVILANKSGERGRPGVEMAVVFLIVFGSGWWISGFSTPASLFASMALANLASLFAGLRHLSKAGEMRYRHSLIPGWKDVTYISGAAKRYTLQIVGKVRSRRKRTTN